MNKFDLDILKKHIKPVLGFSILLFVVVFGFQTKIASADSLNLSIPVPYMETVNSSNLAPQPNVSFEIDLTASLGAPTAGVLNVNGINACSTLNSCWFEDSDGNNLGASVNIASIPGSATYYYKIQKGGSVSGFQGLHFTLAPNGCGGSCPATATANATIKVIPTPAAGVAVDSFVFYGETSPLAPVPAPQFVDIYNRGGTVLNWTATTDQTWCHLSASSGSVPAFNMGGVSVSFDSPAAAGLSAGIYTCTITWTDTSGNSWVWPSNGASYYYNVTDSSNYKVLLSLDTCNAITLNWSAFPGATSYNIYRSDYLDNGYNFSDSVKIKSNYVGLNYIDSDINLETPAGFPHYDTHYAYWVEPVGTSDGPIPAVLKSKNPNGPADIVALRCGGAMMAAPSSYGSASVTSGGAGILMGGGTTLYNLGNAILNWTASSTEPACSLTGAFGSGNPASGSIPSGGNTNVQFIYSKGLNRPGVYDCTFNYGPEQYSSPEIMTLKAADPPSYPTADTSACGQVTLHWYPGSDATGYQIIRAPHGPTSYMFTYGVFTDPDAVVLGTVNATPYPMSGDQYTFVDTTAVPGTHYDYGIQTTNGLDFSGWLQVSMPSESYNTDPAQGDSVSASCQTQVTGVCGGADKAYPVGSTSYGSDTYCSTGTPSATPAFPTPGNPASWICDGSSGGSDSGVCTASVDASQYSLTIVKTIGGWVTSSDNNISCGITCAANYDPNSVVTLTAHSDFANWKFVGWGGDCSGTGTCDVNVTGTKTVWAKFVPIPLNYGEF